MGGNGRKWADHLQDVLLDGCPASPRIVPQADFARQMHSGRFLAQSCECATCQRKLQPCSSQVRKARIWITIVLQSIFRVFVISTTTHHAEQYTIAPQAMCAALGMAGLKTKKRHLR